MLLKVGGMAILDMKAASVCTDMVMGSVMSIRPP